MHSHTTIKQIAAVCIALLVGACASAPEVVYRQPQPPPVATPEPAPAKKLKPVAVVVSRDLASYEDMLGHLEANLSRPYEVFELKGRSPQAVANSVAALRPSAVVAIGRPALEIMSSVADIDLIYAQVFNPPRTRRGVEPMPPFEMQLRYWRQMAPHVRHIGVLGSASMGPVMSELELACAALGMQLIRHQVKSDKEALVAFRRMIPQIDGFVFLPDESILSPDVIRKIIVHGSRNDRQILVYSPAMYQLGAFLYVGAKQRDVAAQIITLVENPHLRSLPLTEMRTQARGQIASNERP